MTGILNDLRLTRYVPNHITALLMTNMKPKFCLSTARDGKFEPRSGYRDWSKIRDLGLSEATHGEYDAFVTRANQMGGKGGRHYHEYDFQIMYVLKGWVKMFYEGEGEFTLEAGDFVYHPPRHVHDLMEYSEDIEILELFSPRLRCAIDV